MSGINKKFIEAISSLESRFDISTVRFNGYFIWPFYRTYLYDLYVSRFTNSKPKRISYKKSLLFKYVLSLITSIFGCMFFLLNRKDTLVLSSEERLKGYNGTVYERVAGAYQGKANFILNPDFRSINKIKIFRKHIPSTFYLVVAHIIKRVKRELNHKGLEVVKEVMDELSLEFPVDKFTRSFYVKYYAAKLILRLHKPKEVVVVNSASFYPFIVACKEANVIVKEIQHGVINEHHPNYNFQFDLCDNSTCWPNDFLSWGRYFDEQLESSCFYQNVNIQDYYYYFLFLIKQNMLFKGGTYGHPRFDPTKKNILLTGQVETEDILSSLALKLTEVEGVNIIYCPRLYSEESRMALTNKGIIIDPEVGFYSVLPYTDVHISVFSTTLLESISLGVKTILFSAMDIADDYFLHLVDDESLFRFTSEEEIVDSILGIAELPSVIRPLINVEPPDFFEKSIAGY